MESDGIHPSYCLNIAIVKYARMFTTRLEMPGKSRKEESENIDDCIDKCRDISPNERIVERWMMRQAKRCLERGDEDWSEWFGKKRWESFNRRDFCDEEANKI